MSGDRILGAVVTFNPDDSLPAHLESLRPQCAGVVVIDNGSANADWVEQVAREAGCVVVKNATNLGVAAALSQAARMAIDGGFDWLATFDQDSDCAAGSLDGLLALHRKLPEPGRVGVLALSHRDRALGRDYHHPADILATEAGWRTLRSTITSGSMVRVAIFRELGLFDDKLFIDSVDHEFCLRARKRGWLVIESTDHVMAHSIGAATDHVLFGRHFACTHHSPTRRYYMTRNQLEVCARNAFFDPVWAGKGLLQLASSTVVTMLCERQRWAKLRAILSGAMHFALRRFGPR